MGGLVVAGALANKVHQGGEAWVRLSWLRGLERLGFDVTFVEVVQGEVSNRAVEYFADVTDTFGFGTRAALIDAEGMNLSGLATQELHERADDAVALIDISGSLRQEGLRRRARRKIYVDIDPGFTQFWFAQGGLDELRLYDDFVTIAENIGSPDCEIPMDLPWLTTRQPVVLEDWGAVGDAAFDRFTTIGTWRGGFGRVTFAGKTYGLKLHEFRKFIDVPVESGLPFELALNIHPDEVDDVRLLDEKGWRVVNPAAAAATPQSFRDYVRGSGAEFSVAQGIYVETNSGWFSDRSLRYLASGRPVLVQDTGFSRVLPTGEGLLGFTTIQEAVAGAHAIHTDYAGHAEAARAVAESHFESDMVLGRLLDQLGIGR